MSPVLTLPFPAAASLWSKVTIALFVASGVMVAGTFRLGVTGVLLASASALTSFPLVIDLLFGQLSGLLLLGVTALYAGQVHGRPALSSLGLFLLSAKPHLFAPVVAAIAVSELRRKRLRTAGWTLGFVLATAALAEWLSPGAVLNWVQHLFFPRTDLGVKPTSFWTTDAPAGALARALTTAGETPRWPLLILPTIGLGTGLLCGSYRQLDWRSAYPPLVWLGFAAAPFVWFSDFAVLGFLQAVAVSTLLANRAFVRGVCAFIGAFLLHVVAHRLEQAGTPHFGLTEMFWFPGAVMALYLFAVMRVRIRHPHPR